MLREPSGFKRFPKPQGWIVTVSHGNPTHSSRGVSWLLQALLITRGQSAAVPGCVCVWLLYWQSCVFWFARQLLLSVIFMQVVSTLWNSSEISQLSSRAEFGTPCWPSFILSFPCVPSQCGVFMSCTWLSLAKCDCSVHKPMWMQYFNKIWHLCCIFLNLWFSPTFVSSEDSCESWNYFDGRIF